MIDLNKHKLKLEYPCSWKYKIVLVHTCDPSVISKDIFGEREHKIEESKRSKKGKFKSYNIELTVHSDEDRTNLHKLLSEHNDTKMVL